MNYILLTYIFINLLPSCVFGMLQEEPTTAHNTHPNHINPRMVEFIQEWDRRKALLLEKYSDTLDTIRNERTSYE